MILELSKTEKSRLYLNILNTLNASTGDSVSSIDAARQAFAEVTAFVDDRAEVFDLASSIDGHVYHELFYSDYDYAEVCPDLLPYEAQTIRLALGLAGFHARQYGTRIVWSNSYGGEPTLKIELPANL